MVCCILYFVISHPNSLQFKTKLKGEEIRIEIIFHAFQSKIDTVVAHFFPPTNGENRRFQIKLHLIQYISGRGRKKD